MPGRAAAFFDFDKTLMDTETTMLMIRYIWKKRKVFLKTRHVPPSFIIRVLVANELYKRHLYADEKMAALLLEFFKGRLPAPFHATASDLYQTYLRPHLAPNLMARLAEHKQLHDLCVLVSAGVRYALEQVVQDLGFDHLLCTDLEIDRAGLYTGRSTGLICIDKHKQTMALALAKAHDIELAVSSAYGNHQSDIPLLETVGHPFAVEPTEPLRRAAIERGWPILTYR